MTLDGKSIARCAKPKNFENVTSFVLHHLSPVKDTGYGQSSYVRLVKHMYQFPTFNKIQGCTITFILIPRLELTTATLSPKGSKILNDKLDIDDHDEEF